MLGLHYCTGFSLAAVCRLLIAMAPLVVSTGSRAPWPQELWHMDSIVGAPGLWSTGSIEVVRGLSCSAAHGILLDQGSDI